jgi:hypothetical protein
MVGSGFIVKSGARGLSIDPQLYFIDSIDISSFCKDAIFKKDTQIYGSGQYLAQVSQTLQIPKSTLISVMHLKFLLPIFEKY